MPIAMKPVEIGVCLEDKTWGFHVVPVPRQTEEGQLLDAATTAFLDRHPDALVYRTWLQCVGEDFLTPESEEA